MGKRRLLEAYLHGLVGAQQEAGSYIRFLRAMMAEETKRIQDVCLITSLDNSSGSGDQSTSSSTYEISIASRLKHEVMTVTRIQPAMVLEVRNTKRFVDLSLHWQVQVECVEHQHKWELATCTEGSKKKGKTEFASELLLPLHLAEDVSNGCWSQTLPGVQLNYEQGIKNECARECQLDDHRFHFRVCLVNANHDPVSNAVFSSSFHISSYTPGVEIDQFVFKQAQKARKVSKYIKVSEILERVATTKLFLLEERPNIVRIDSEYDDADILKQFTIASTSSVRASVKVPSSPCSWKLKVRNFDDPNLDSVEYLNLNFVARGVPPEPEISSEMFEGLTPLFLEMLDTDYHYMSLPPQYSFDVEEKVEDVVARYKKMEKSKFSVVTSANSFSDHAMLYYHIMNGYTHTVAAMLNSIDSPNKNSLKMKFGAVPAMLSLLSENPCTAILCISLFFFERHEISHADFKRLLSYILCTDRGIPLHPHMMMDFLETEINFDARIRLVQTTVSFSEHYITAAEEPNMSDDDDSPYQSEEDECASTSDEDYEEPPAKLCKSTPSASGAPLKICIKIEQPKDGGFAHITKPPPPTILAPKEEEKSGDDSSPHGECEWEHCLVCDRDIPIMLQTQNPTWAAIMRVVFFSFIRIFPNTEYWKVRQAYKYIEDHWVKLCPGKSQASGAWRKQLQDALSHNKQYFISGMNKYGQKGYWGLKQIIDPWAITDEVDFPKRAYHHQPRRGRPPKGNGKKKKAKKMFD